MNMKWPFRHGFWETVAVLLLSLADVSSHQGHLLSHTPSHSVRPRTQLEVIFSGWHGPSFKQTVKRHLKGGNESSWELSGGWVYLDNGVFNRKILCSHGCLGAPSVPWVL